MEQYFLLAECPPDIKPKSMVGTHVYTTTMYQCVLDISITLYMHLYTVSG